MEPAVIQTIVLVISCRVSVGSNSIDSNFGKCLLGTKNGNITELGFKIGAQINQVVLRISTSLGLGFIKIAIRAELIECRIDLRITVLNLGVDNLTNDIIEVDSTRVDTSKFFVHTNAIHIQSRHDGTNTVDSLSTQTESTLSHRIHNVTNIILYLELHSITFSEVVVIYGIHEEVVFLETIFARDGNHLFDLGEHLGMVAERLLSNLNFAAIHSDELFSKNLLRIISGIVSLSATTFISIDGKLNKVFHICISPFVYFYKLQNANDIVGISTNSLNRFYSTDLLGTGSNGSHSVRLSASNGFDNRTNDYGITGCNSKSFLSYSVNTAGMQTITTADLASLVGILREIVLVLLRHLLNGSNENQIRNYRSNSHSFCLEHFAAFDCASSISVKTIENYDITIVNFCVSVGRSILKRNQSLTSVSAEKVVGSYDSMFCHITFSSLIILLSRLHAVLLIKSAILFSGFGFDSAIRNSSFRSFLNSKVGAGVRKNHLNLLFEICQLVFVRFRDQSFKRFYAIQIGSPFRNKSILLCFCRSVFYILLISGKLFNLSLRRRQLFGNRILLGFNCFFFCFKCSLLLVHLYGIGRVRMVRNHLAQLLHKKKRGFSLFAFKRNNCKLHRFSGFKINLDRVASHRVSETIQTIICIPPNIHFMLLKIRITIPIFSGSAPFGFNRSIAQSATNLLLNIAGQLKNFRAKFIIRNSIKVDTDFIRIKTHIQDNSLLVHFAFFLLSFRVYIRFTRRERLIAI
nr:MAG TPA: hypothetical protein [Caudoviricetes sp.]